MKAAGGFTKVELAAVVAATVIVAAVVLIVLPAIGHSGMSAHLKDSSQLRGLHQAMVAWGRANNDEYPLPSRLDVLNHTVAEEGRAKDTTANIFSILAYGGLIAPEILVSPVETNRSVHPCDDYEHESPRKAVTPSKALWDPKLSAVLDGSVKGNISYAHLQPAGDRIKRFWATFAAMEAVLANRGPEIAGVRKGTDGSVTPTFADPRSNTLRFFGKSRSWSGNVAFNDGHVDFLSRALTSGAAVRGGRTFAAADGKAWPDILFFDEPDDLNAGNDFLGIFLKAGETPAEFKAAWD